MQEQDGLGRVKKYTVLYSMYNIKNNKNGIKVDGKSNYRIVQEQKKIKDIIQDF